MSWVRLIGYWAPADPREPDWPDPQDFVDAAWDATERSLVARHLEGGDLFVRYRGLSICRFCEQDNGSAEYTDGDYVWPEGLAHYVLEHNVRLPAEFVSHVVRSRGAFDGSPQYDHRGQRVRVLGEEELATLYDVTVNQGWWLQQRSH